MRESVDPSLTTAPGADGGDPRLATADPLRSVHSETVAARSAPHARIALASLAVPAIVALIGGGLAGALLNAYQTSQRSGDINRRVVATVRVDLDRLDETLAHNIRTVEPI